MTTFPIYLLYFIPLLTGIFCLMPLPARWLGYIQIIGMTILLGFTLMLIFGIYTPSQPHVQQIAHHFLIAIDALSVLLLLIISLIGLLASLYASPYMMHEYIEGKQKTLKLKGFYLLFNLFLLSMLAMVTTYNLGIFWVCIEASTLFSAFLVGYNNQKESLEAAWKYIILCTVGIAFALIGLIMGYYAVTQAGGVESKALDWNYLMSIAHHLDPVLMKVAFVFVLIGFGTKAGLAPLHSWLPDAHSEAPTPVSALLSGVLLNCALYGIIRYSTIVNLAIGEPFTNQFFLFFGMLSLAIAAPFILVQRNIKRLLAYSSLENVGLITVGLGFGTPLSIFGALFHMLNHALVKSLMFFTAGNIIFHYRSKYIHEIQGVCTLFPQEGLFLLIGSLALVGLPPFSIFISKFLILAGGIQAHYWKESLFLITLLVIVFGGLTAHFTKMCLSPPSQDINHSISQKNSKDLLPLFLSFGLLLVLGIWQPSILLDLLNDAVQIITTPKIAGEFLP